MTRFDSPLREGREARLRGEDHNTNPYRKMRKKGGTWGELELPLSADWWDAGWEETDRQEEDAA